MPSELRRELIACLQWNSNSPHWWREALRQAEHLFQTLLHMAFSEGV